MSASDDAESTDAPPGPDDGERPLVSVIISAYNVADYIGAAIDSTLAQTYPNLEVIVVNDGSTDDTAAVIERYRADVVIVDRPNGGPSAARNSGLRVARGALIAMLDGDDTWLPDRIERLVDLLDARPDLDMVTSDSWVMEDFTPTTRRSYVDRRKRPFPRSEHDQIEEIARFNFLFIAVVFRRELYERCGGFTEGARRGADVARLQAGLPVDVGEMSVEGSEDFDLWARFVISGARAGFIDEPLGYYRERSGSVSQSSVHQARAHLSVLERNLPALWKQGARGYARATRSRSARASRRAAGVAPPHGSSRERCAPKARRGRRARMALSAAKRLARPSPDWAENPLPGPARS